MRRLLLGSAMASLLCAVPVAITPGEGFGEARACADGTCCPEPGSDCIINNILTENAYAKMSGGTCKKEPVRPG